MKKLFYFTISISVTVIIFLMIALIVLGIGAFRITHEKTSSPSAPKQSVATKSVDVAVILADGDKCFVTGLSVDRNGKMSFSTFDLQQTNDPITLKAIIDSEGFYRLIGRLSSTSKANELKYIILDGKNFAKITDMYGGIVYNNNTNYTVLLTGEQARQVLTADNFTKICADILKKAYEKNFGEFFVYLCNNTENNLSYPEFYNIYEALK